MTDLIQRCEMELDVFEHDYYTSSNPDFAKVSTDALIWGWGNNMGCSGRNTGITRSVEVELTLGRCVTKEAADKRFDELYDIFNEAEYPEPIDG